MINKKDIPIKGKLLSFFYLGTTGVTYLLVGEIRMPDINNQNNPW